MISKLMAILLFIAGSSQAADVQDAWYKDKNIEELAKKVRNYRPSLLKEPGRHMTKDGLLAWGTHKARSLSGKDLVEAGKISEILAYKEIAEHYHGAIIRSKDQFDEKFEDDLENPKIKRTFRQHTEMIVRGVVYGVEKVSTWRSGKTIVRVYRVVKTK